MWRVYGPYAVVGNVVYIRRVYTCSSCGAFWGQINMLLTIQFRILLVCKRNFISCTWICLHVWNVWLMLYVTLDCCVCYRMDRNYDCLLKVLLCGDSGVGKTCLISQFTDGQVRKSHITTIGKNPTSIPRTLCVLLLYPLSSPSPAKTLPLSLSLPAPTYTMYVHH